MLKDIRKLGLMWTLSEDIAKPILVYLMANAHYKTQIYRPSDNT